jgi:hypothetical protein
VTAQARVFFVLEGWNMRGNSAAFLAIGAAFLALGAGGSGAYLGVGAAFLAISFGMWMRARKSGR